MSHTPSIRTAHPQPTLDDLYRMTSRIFSEQNADRPPVTTFAHFVEVCGMLSIHDRRKRREGINVTDALCKALGWFFPLMAKFRVASVEDLIFRKFPYVCPYCRMVPHEDGPCKTVRGTARTVDHVALTAAYTANSHMRPRTLDAWQLMFARIYPRSADERAGRSTVGLLEELGEMAEAIRVFDRHPKYFAGEAADVFSYLMGIANEHTLVLAQADQQPFSFEVEFIRRYPGLCSQCGYQVCVCPAIPEATVGRMAKELDLNTTQPVFGIDGDTFERQGRDVADAVLDSVGVYSTLAALPFDRGQMNSTLVFLAARLGQALEGSDPALAGRFKSIAVMAASSVARAGARGHSEIVTAVLGELRDLLPKVGPEITVALSLQGEGLVGQVGKLLRRRRVLLILSCPRGETAIRLEEEERAVREAIQLSENREQIHLDALPAATVDDLSRALLKAEYDIVHFAGHGTLDAMLLFEDAVGNRAPAPVTALAELIGRYESITCVVLNACYSLAAITVPLANLTVGMEAPVSDQAAIEFARGFYDALGAGRDEEFAVKEGTSRVHLKRLEKGLPLKVLRRSAVPAS